MTVNAGPWFIDGNNVMGSRPDGWWNDRPKAMARLTQEIAEWCWDHDDPVTVVFDGRTVPAVADLAGGTLAVRFAERSARNAADDLIVELVAELDARCRVVTADRGLADRLGALAETVGPRTFLEMLAGD